MVQAHRKAGAAKGNNHKIVVPPGATDWAATYADKLESLEELRAEGWLCASEVAQQSGCPLSVARQRLRHDSRLDRKMVKAHHAGIARSMYVYRPKSMGETG